MYANLPILIYLKNVGFPCPCRRSRRGPPRKVGEEDYFASNYIKRTSQNLDF